MELIQLFLAPFCLTVLLVGIHAYLGLHVLKREVIFVDISLSQVAALGGALALYFFHEESGWISTSFSLFLCLFVALVLAFLRKHEKKIPQEAIVGITYAMASGCLILALDRIPHGTEHIKEVLVGNILFVTWEQVLLTLLIYSGVGLVHFIFRKAFWESSEGKSNSLFWDFLFYFLFGIVITFSTQHAGVLVVFSILVIPATLATRWTSRRPQQLLLAWSIGSLCTLLGFALSYWMDFPAGASLVVSLATSFFLVLFFKRE